MRTAKHGSRKFWIIRTCGRNIYTIRKLIRVCHEFTGKDDSKKVLQERIWKSRGSRESRVFQEQG